MNTHNMFLWLNKKNLYIITFRVKKKVPYLGLQQCRSEFQMQDLHCLPLTLHFLNHQHVVKQSC